MTKSDAIDVSTPSAATHARYDEYEDSGLDWLGEIPTHWERVRLKFLAAFTGGGTPSKDNREYWEGDIPWVSPKDMKAGRVNDTQDHITQEAVAESSTRLVKPGSVLMVVRSGILKHTIPVATNEMEVALNQDLKAITPDDSLHSRYLLYLIEGRNDTLLLKWTKSGTTVESLNQQRISNTEIPVPPLGEQRAIATYLDRETERIDALIKKKEQLIDLLEEKRTALISRVVTKGLDADVEMQDSGVEWLGEIPADWDTGKVGYLCRDVADGPHHSPDYVEGSEGIPFLSARHVKVDRWALDDDLKYISEEDYNEFCSRVTPEKGDVLYTKGGTTGIARVVDLDFRFHVWVHVAVLKPKTENVVPGYLAYSLNSKACYNQAQLFTRGATNNDLGLTRLIDIQLAVPSLSEQRTITKRLDEETAQIDALIKRVEDGVERLEEYRTTLISAAVTGQIDVREKVRL